MSHLDFDIFSVLELRISNLGYINSKNSYVRIYNPFMQNKPNFRNDKMYITTTVTMNYVILSHWLRPKNKPNSKPIKPKTNPIKAKTNPIQTQFPERPKLMQCVYLQRIMNKNAAMDQKKTNPIAKIPQRRCEYTFLLFFFLNLMAGYADKNV